MIDPHIHCSECFAAIPTKILCSGGKTKDAELNFMQQARVVPAGGQGQLAVIPVNVPLCDGCAERIKQQLQRQQAASKLVVPGLSLAKKQRPS